MFWNNLFQTLELTGAFALQYASFILLAPFYLFGMMAEAWYNIYNGSL